MTCSASSEFDRGSGNAVLASGATRLVLREVTGAAPISRRLVHVNLEVDDIEAAYRAAQGHRPAVHLRAPGGQPGHQGGGVGRCVP